MAKNDEIPSARKRVGKQRDLDDGDENYQRGPQGTVSENYQRNLEIYRAHLRALDNYDLAATYGLSVKQIERIITEMRKDARRITKSNPLEVIDEVTRQIDSGISEIAAVAARETGSARVTAVLGRINAILNKARWLQKVGVIPTEPETMRVQIDAVALGERLMMALDKKGALDEEILELIADGLGHPIDGTGTEILDRTLPPAK